MLNEEQMKDVQSRIDEASKEVTNLLEKYELAIAAKVVKVEVAPGVFADSVQIGYTDSKFSKKEEDKKEVKLEE